MHTLRVNIEVMQSGSDEALATAQADLAIEAGD